MNEILEYHDDYTPKDHRRVLQPKRHHCILEASPFCHKGRLTPILRCNLDLMVPREPICEHICFLAANIIQDLINEWSWEGIMHAGIIQLPKIYTYPYLFLLLLFHEPLLGLPNQILPPVQ